MIQTTLTLFGASAVIVAAIIFVCKPVLVNALSAMRNAELPIARMMFIGLWAFAVAGLVLWMVSNAAVALHASTETATDESGSHLRENLAAAPTHR
jgi:hypothetical protein